VKRATLFVLIGGAVVSAAKPGPAPVAARIDYPDGDPDPRACRTTSDDGDRTIAARRLFSIVRPGGGESAVANREMPAIVKGLPRPQKVRDPVHRNALILAKEASPIFEQNPLLSTWSIHLEWQQAMHGQVGSEVAASRTRRSSDSPAKSERASSPPHQLARCQRRRFPRRSPGLLRRYGKGSGSMASTRLPGLCLWRAPGPASTSCKPPHQDQGKLVPRYPGHAREWRPEVVRSAFRRSCFLNFSRRETRGYHWQDLGQPRRRTGLRLEKPLLSHGRKATPRGHSASSWTLTEGDTVPGVGNYGHVRLPFFFFFDLHGHSGFRGSAVTDMIRTPPDRRLGR